VKQAASATSRLVNKANDVEKGLVLEREDAVGAIDELVKREHVVVGARDDIVVVRGEDRHTKAKHLGLLVREQLEQIRPDPTPSAAAE
jgi:hypothetical protein